MKIGIIGVGAIGSVLCKFIDKELEDSELAAICDIYKNKAKKISSSLKSKPIVTNIDTLIKKSDLVIEAVKLSEQYHLNFIHVRSHTGIKDDPHYIGNDIADKLAVDGATSDFLNSIEDIGNYKLTFGKYKNISIKY